MADPATSRRGRDLLYGAYLSGVALGTTRPGCTTRSCHVLGGTFNLVHADAHSVVLPACRRVQRAGRCRPRWRAWPRRSARRGDDPAGRLWDLARAPATSRRRWRRWASRAMTSPEARAPAADEITDNPRPSTRPTLLGLLERGVSPASGRSTRTERWIGNGKPLRATSSTPCARRSAASAARSPACGPTTWPPRRCAGCSIGLPDLDTGDDRRGRTSATPTRRARTTATSPGWRCCWRACRRLFPAPRSTGCAAPGSRRSSAPAARWRSATPTSLLAGGVESMSRAPWVLPKPAKGYPTGHEQLWSTTLGWRMTNPKMPEQWTVSLGEGAELLADKYSIGREEQDEFALGRTSAPRRRGTPAAFDAEIVSGRRSRPRPRRVHPRRHHAREAGRAEAGVPPEAARSPPATRRR